MLRFWNRKIAAAVLVVACLAASGRGQESVLADLYGNGVHAYFSGNLQQSLGDLTAAVDAGSKDPRVFYFRGLVERRLGMEGNADDDFARGAELEANAADRFYPISRSLERIQGMERVAIERHRAKARAIAYQLSQSREQKRYQQIERAEADVLRDIDGAPPTNALPAEQPAAPQDATAPAETDPFAEPVAKPEAKAPAEADPFAEEAPAKDTPAKEAPAEDMPAEDDPFAAGDDKAADEKPAPKAEAEDDPFAADDEKPAAEEKPKADEPAAATDDDPFADDKAEEAPKAEDKPADEKPAEEKPADKAEAEEDPFG